MHLPDNPEPGSSQRSSARALALPRQWQPALGWRVADGRQWLSQAWSRELEQRRLFPWTAVCYGAGILLFFQAEGKPALWAPVCGLVAFAVLAIALRAHLPALAVCIGFAMVFAGFTTGAIRTRAVDAPILRRIVIGSFSGFIEAVEDRPDGKRLLVRVGDLKGVTEADRPVLVRVSVRRNDPLVAGQFITGNARLLPPPQPAWPGGYDFGRDAYFRGIGGVGSVLGTVRIIDPPTLAPLRFRLGAAVDEARNVLTQRIASAIGGPAGGVGAALVTGKRGLIPEPTNDVLRAAGIYHIVSISGLHMVLAAGTFFWLARAFLSLFPTLALLWPIKKLAAVIAMAGALGYCVFSGSDVATVRSLLMTLVMFGAVLVDRPAVSVRNLAISALIVLAREPESLLGPSFQMSFAAVAALSAFMPLLQRRAPNGRPTGLIDRGLRFVGGHAMGLVTTTLIATVATAPFSAYHFQTLNPYGLVGNAVALPLVSLVVMPAAVLGVLAFPFGLDRPIWQMMGAAVAQVLDIATWVGGFGGSTLVVPALGLGAVALLSLALLIAVLAASSLRWLALMPAAIGMAFAATPMRADLYIDRDGQGAAIRGRDGALTFVGKTSAFVAEQWLKADGDARDPDDASLHGGSRCDPAGCVVDVPDGHSVAFVLNASAFAEDCRRAEIVITRLKAPSTCKALLVLDRETLAARGATTLRLGAAAIAIRSVHKGDETVARLAPSPQPPGAAAPARVRALPERDLPDADPPDGEVSSGEPD
ncbi:ComEC/Rec2 family competence protein [Microvirga antarctica]|uniref:ComEC/Rec2 family competence protein n=1 Tax=Microvirga antarctica TaxID=2819233 RepID=UPI001B3116F8|nr:ComEC/Rec2 family competence protein [Microvirga antarctica]